METQNSIGHLAKGELYGLSLGGQRLHVEMQERVRRVRLEDSSKVL